MDEVQPGQEALPEPAPSPVEAPPRKPSQTRFALLALVLLAASLYADWWFLLRQESSPPRKAASDEELKAGALRLLDNARSLARSGALPADVEAAYDRVVDVPQAPVEARVERMRLLIQRYLERIGLPALPSEEGVPATEMADDEAARLRTTLLSDAATLAHVALSKSDEEDVRAIEEFLTRQPVPEGGGWVSRCLRAWTLLDSGHPDEAGQCVAKAIEAAPTQDLPSWIRARAGGKKGDFDALIQRSPGHAVYWADRAARRRGEHDKAMSDLSRALALAQGHPGLLARMAATEEDARRWAQAVPWLGEAIARVPDSASLLLHRARLYKRLKMLEQACADYDQARHAAPDSVPVLEERADLLLRVGRAQEALEDAEHAAQLRGDSTAGPSEVLVEALIESGRAEALLMRFADDTPAMHARRSRALRALERPADALTEAQKAHDPVQEALCHLALGDDKRALAAIGTAWTATAPGCETFARIRLTQQAWNEALGAIDAAIAKDPLRAVSHALRGQALIGLTRWDDALAAFEEALAIDPATPLALRGEGEARMRKGDLEGAREAFDRAIPHAQKDPRCWRLRGELRWRMRDEEGAVKDLTRSLQLDPTQADVYVARGGIELADSDTVKARADAEEAVHRLPGDVGVWTLLARVALAEKKPDDADRAVSEALRIDPHHAPALVARAEVKLLRKDRAGARADLGEALAAQADLADALYARGGLSVEETRWEEAAADLERFLAKHADDPREAQARAWLDLARTALKRR